MIFIHCNSDIFFDKTVSENLYIYDTLKEVIMESKTTSRLQKAEETVKKLKIKNKQEQVDKWFASKKTELLNLWAKAEEENKGVSHKVLLSGLLTTIEANRKRRTK